MRRAKDGLLLLSLALTVCALSATAVSAQATHKRPVAHRSHRHRAAHRHLVVRHSRRGVVGRITSVHKPSATPRNNSAWLEPALRSPTTIVLSDANRNLALDQHRDFVLVCPPGRMSLTWALSVWGGHNVVFQNCDINVTIPDWAAHFKDQSGTLWLRNVHFGGTHLTGGVQLQEPGATVVMRDVLFDTVHGSYATNHAECLQTWSGPARLLIDGLTCSTTYQGLFLLPNQWDSRTRETTWDLRNVDISALGAYALWLGNAQPSNLGVIPAFHTQNVYVGGPGEPRNWDGTSDGDHAWDSVTGGAPPTGHFVTAAPGGATGADDGAAPVPLTGER